MQPQPSAGETGRGTYYKLVCVVASFVHEGSLLLANLPWGQHIFTKASLCNEGSLSGKFCSAMYSTLNSSQLLVHLYTCTVIS